MTVSFKSQRLWWSFSGSKLIAPLVLFKISSVLCPVQCCSLGKVIIMIITSEIYWTAMCTAIYIFVSIIFITIKLHILLITLKIMSYGRANFSKKKKRKNMLSPGATFYLDLLIFMTWWFLHLSLFSYFLLEILHFFLLHKYPWSLGLWPQPLLFNFNIFFPKSYCPL